MLNGDLGYFRGCQKVLGFNVSRRLEKQRIVDVDV
jgi:hypothetical protein